MAYKPSIRSIWTLALLATIFIALYAWSENSRVQRRMPYYEEKLAAARLMERALNVFQESRGVNPIDSTLYQDPRLSAIIGQQFTSVTTDFGVFESKLLGANPNFAAAAIELLIEAGVQKGDLVAVGLTGSHPGVNTAVLCACDVLGAKPVTIASVGASWWGANDPDFTWVDMEHLLNEKGIIHSRQIGASFGGPDDNAVGLSGAGQMALKDAIERNGIPLIQERSVVGSVERRWQLFQQAAAGARYRVYVNIGGGVASLGHPENSLLVPNGYSRKLPVKNYPSFGAMHKFSSAGVGVLNLHDIEKLSRTYGLGPARIPLSEVGMGEVFESERYDLLVVAISTGLAVLILVLLVRLDAKLFRLRDAGVDPDTLM